MEEWLKQLVPTHDLVPILGAVGLWIWHHRKMIKRGEFRDAADAAITEVVHGIVADPPNRERAAKLFSDVAWSGLRRLGVKGEPEWASDLVELAVQEGLAELQQEVSKRQLAEIASGTAGVAASFTPPANPTVPPLGGGMIEITEDKAP